MAEFVPFPKMARLNRDYVITEKIDGSNAQVTIYDDEGELRHVVAGSRKRWITPGKTTDNFGFAGWVRDNEEDLLKLGVGTHYGEWWGQGIQRGYGRMDRVFSLFNTGRWVGNPDLPTCCQVVPILGFAHTLTQLAFEVDSALHRLRTMGSFARRGWKTPEGIVVYSTAANACFKVTLENDEVPKALAEKRAA